MKIKHYSLLLLAGIFCVNAFAQPVIKTQQVSGGNGGDKFSGAELTYKIIDAPNHTYGYDVFADGNLMIHQTSIPALPGNDGFKAKVDAEKVAQLVITKIKNGEMPPTISVEELKKLKVID